MAQGSSHCKRQIQDYNDVTLFEENVRLFSISINSITTKALHTAQTFSLFDLFTSQELMKMQKKKKKNFNLGLFYVVFVVLCFCVCVCACVCTFSLFPLPVKEFTLYFGLKKCYCVLPQCRLLTAWCFSCGLCDIN